MGNTPAELYHLHKEQFDHYQSLLLKWNEKINLTAITRPEEIKELHFIDSLAAAPQIVSRETISPTPPLQKGGEGGISLLDIGAGAGFPGIPIKIIRPDIELTVIDSVKKKCDFMKTVSRDLKLHQTRVFHQTLSGQSIGLYDVIITRATFSLRAYLELALPNLKSNGIIMAMKGLGIEEELKASSERMKELGLQPWESITYELPISKTQRQLLVTRFI